MTPLDQLRSNVPDALAYQSPGHLLPYLSPCVYVLLPAGLDPTRLLDERRLGQNRTLAEERVVLASAIGVSCCANWKA